MANTKITTSVIADGAITSAKLDTDISVSGSITGTLATAAQPNITSVGTLTGFTSTGIDDNATSTAITIDSSENVGIGTSPSDPNSKGRVLQLHGTSSSELRFTGSTYGVGANDGVSLGLNFGGFDINNPRDTGYTRFMMTSGEAMRINNLGTLLLKSGSIPSNQDSPFLYRIGGGGLGLGAATETGTTAPIVFYTDSTEKMRITSDGGISIGSSGTVRKDLSSSSSPTLSLEGTFPALNLRDTSGHGCFYGINGDAVYLGGHTNTATMGMFVNGSEKMRILSSGGITFNGDTAAANALDDYEEGTFDASITPGSGSYTLNSSYSKLGYTKIGRVVTITGQIVLSGASGASGTVTIGDLPFEMLNATERSSQTRPSIHIYASGSGAPASGYYPAFIAFNEGLRSGTLIVTYNNTHDSTPADWLTGGSDLFINFSYHAA